MKILLLILVLLHLHLRAGTITGLVTAEGKIEASSRSESRNYSSRKYKFLEKVDYSAFEDFVVYLDFTPTNSPPASRKVLQVITQRNGVFRPHVLPLVVGTTVEWPNQDDIFHNVFSMSETKPFDLGLYKHPEVKRVLFDKPGRVDVFCSIHSQMSCIILVLENPWFALTDSKGYFKIPHVPAGRYRIKAWHKRLPPEAKEIEVPESGEVKVNFILGIKNLPQY